MASWHRAVVGRSHLLSLLHGRLYGPLGYGARTSAANCGGGWVASSTVPEESGGARLRECARYVCARFFAVLVQARNREEQANAPQGPRLNDAITAKFIRLVTDEGHAVVSREVALDRARRLDLDLVEVQRTAKPPVCKIMDYHKEKYKKETTEKERAKSKSESTLRKGNFKEVRLKGTIEQKDIEVKAEAVKRLIERGYRVKCMALPSKQGGTEECDLGALLSRLTDLIEDVTVIESGPFFEKQQAYVVVRHAKFGSKKSSRKKDSKTIESTSGTGSVPTLPIAFDGCTSDADAVGVTDIDEETEDEILSDAKMDAPNLRSSATASPLVVDSATNGSVDGSNLTETLDRWGAVVDMTERSPASGSMKAKLGSERDQIDRHVSPNPSVSRSDFSTEDSNRYSRRTEMKFGSDQTKAAGRNQMIDKVKVAPERSGFSDRFSKSPGNSNLRWTEQQRSNQGNTRRHTPLNENQKRGHLDLKQGQMPTHGNSPAPSYGIFSSQRSSVSNAHKMADVSADKEKNSLSRNNAPNTPPKSKVENTQQNNEGAKQGEWGVFSRSISRPSQDKSSG